jgi:hypothetical protein
MLHLLPWIKTILSHPLKGRSKPSVLNITFESCIADIHGIFFFQNFLDSHSIPKTTGKKFC